MELYGSATSPFVRHCRIVLRETELPFTWIEMHGADEGNRSPTQKVPYLEEGDLCLSDSSSIIRHLREKAGQTFLPSVTDAEIFCTVNTLMDAEINLFLFQKLDHLLPEKSVYLSRQRQRVQRGLCALNSMPLPAKLAGNDAGIRLVSFLDWAQFRNRFSLQEHSNLTAFLSRAHEWALFAETAPPKL